MQIIFVSKENEPAKLSLFLRRQGMSASLIRSVKFRENGILLNGEPTKTNAMVHIGDAVTVTLPPEENTVDPEDISLEIVYESIHAMVLEKPAGLVMHPTLSHSCGTMANAFAGLMGRRGQKNAFRPMGRLDANTSGLILCAMNPFSAPLLSENFQKMYLALVSGNMPAQQGTIDAPMDGCPDSAIKQQVIATGKPAQTTYRVLSSSSKGALVAVWPKTGRTHQIRVHFAHIGNPLLGDWLYGGDEEAIKRHALHCAGLRFIEPDGQTQLLKSALPQDMVCAAKNMGLTIPDMSCIEF